MLIPAIGFGLILIILGRRGRATSRTINLPFNLGNVTYDLSEQERVLAWQLHVQLVTRKAALSFDEEHDVIVEVYDSLYDLFSITRSLVMNMPLQEIEKRESVADLMLRVLNDGLRPHLTNWQADFRRWWTQSLNDPANNQKRPQELQRSYPQYVALVHDLGNMNIELSKYAEDLLAIARARPAEAAKERPEAIDPSWIDPDGKFSWADGAATITFGKHKGRALTELAAAEPDYLEWMLDQDFSSEVKQIIGDALNGKFPAAP